MFGAAGSGKTFLLTRLRQLARAAAGTRGLDHKGVVCLAATNAQARLIDGQTIPSFFGLAVLEDGAEYTRELLLAHVCARPDVMRRVRACWLFLMDELLNLSATLLDGILYVLTVVPYGDSDPVCNIAQNRQIVCK